jgi:hypothetical protein
MRNFALLLVVATLAACGRDSRAADAQSWRTMNSARQLADREPHDATVRFGAGTLEIRPAEANMLYEMELRYDETNFSPVAEYDAERRRLVLGVRSPEEGRRGIQMRGLNIQDGATAAIRLSREVPLDLNLEFGAGRANIELGGTTLRRLRVSTGASETQIGFSAPNAMAAEALTIESGAADLRVTGLGNARSQRINFQGGVGATVLDFGGSWDRDATASVQMGIGSLTLRVPRDQGVRINRSSVLSSFSAPGLERQGNTYVSENWESAPHRLTIDVSAALGSVEVRWID